MRSSWIRVGPKSSSKCPYRKKGGHTDTQGRGPMKAEVGVTLWLGPQPGASRVPES